MTDRGPADAHDTSNEAPHVWDDPRNVNRLFRVFYVLCVLLVAMDLLVHRHTVHPIEHLPVFYPLYGFVGITVLVLLARVLRKLVMRPEDYYEDDHDGH